MPFTSEDLRRRGLAQSILRKLLCEGRKKGAEKAYLQVVVADNQAAKVLTAKSRFHSYVQLLVPY